MNTRNLFFTILLIVALALGAGLIMAQDDGGGSDEDSNAKQHQDSGRRGGFGRGFHGFGGRGMAMPRGFGMPGLPALMDLVTEATGLEAAALRDALRAGDSLASLIEANGGDVEAFIAEATATATENATTNIAARIEAMVRGEYGAGMKDADTRGFGRRGMGGPKGFAGRGAGRLPTGMADVAGMLLEATGLEIVDLHSALREGDSLASLIEANGGDVEAFIAAMSENANAMVDAAVESGRLDAERAASYREGMAARLEALVHGEFAAGGKGFDWRGRQQDKGGREGSGEHGSRMGQKVSGGEEAGATLTLDESYDFVRKGVRLIMAWDANANAFVGTVENVTDATISQVRVEVHLSNGVELGPTPTVSLAPGEVQDVELSAAGQEFDGWTPHAETGSGEHSAGDGEDGVGEGEGEHGSNGEGGSG